MKAGSDSTPLIETKGLSKDFNGKLAVDSLDLSTQPGEIFAFLGPNGAGKTTTMKLLVGLLHPTAGFARIGGYDIFEQPVEAKSLMSYVPDSPYLYEKLTAREFLRFYGEIHRIPGSELPGRINEMIERFGMGDYCDELTEGYSHGMKQRVVVSAALLKRPKVLIVDEPVAGLDPRSARTVIESFQEVARNGGTVMLSTHTLPVAERVATRIGIMDKGRIVAEGTIRELSEQASSDASLEDLFLSLTETPHSESGRNNP